MSQLLVTSALCKQSLCSLIRQFALVTFIILNFVNVQTASSLSTEIINNYSFISQQKLSSFRLKPHSTQNGFIRDINVDSKISPALDRRKHRTYTTFLHDTASKVRRAKDTSVSS